MATTNMDTNDKTDDKTASQTQFPSQGIDYDAEHGTLSSPKESSGIPDGGLEAWLVAAGAGCVFFAGLGFVNSNGVFIEYYISHRLRDRPADDIAWIGSLSSFLQFSSGLIGGPLFDRYGAWIIRPSSVVVVFAVMMTSLCEEYWQFMLAQGLLLGIGMGGLMFPAIGAIPQYFDKKRAAALGLAAAGSSIGGVVFPIALSKMLNSSSLGFGWSVRVLGFIMVPPLAFACIVIKSRLPPKSSAFIDLSAFKLPTFNWLTAAGFFMFLGVFTPLFYLPAYAVSRGMNSTLASYLIAIVNGASTFGRIIPGIMADKLGSINVLSSASIVSGIIVCCMTQVKSDATFYVYSILVGFFSGTIVSGIMTSITRTVKDPRETGTYMGMSMAVISMAVLVGPPINGKLLDDYGFFEVALFSGIACLIGGFMGLVAKYTTSEGVFGRT